MWFTERDYEINTMKIVHKNLKIGEVKVQPDSLDDLWHLAQIVEPGDSVKGRTLRKMKSPNSGGGEDARQSKVVRKPVFLTLSVENRQIYKYW